MWITHGLDLGRHYVAVSVVEIKNVIVTLYLTILRGKNASYKSELRDYKLASTFLYFIL